MQDVELLDDAADDDAHDAARDDAATRRMRVHRRRLVAGAATLAVTLGVVQWVVTARDDAAWARLSEVPGVLLPVDATLDVLRRVPSTDAGALFNVARGELKHGEDGSQTYTWTTPSGGGPGWTTELLGPHDTPVITGGYFGGTACQADSERGADLSTARRLVCLVTDGGTLADDQGRLSAEIPATTRQVVVLSTSDGTVEARWPLERGQTFTVLPDDVVVVGSATGGVETVTAYDVLTGAERWTHDEPLPTPTDDALGGMGTVVSRAGDLVLAATPSGRLTLLSRDGDVVRDSFDDLGYFTGGWSTEPSTGALIIETQTADGAARSTLVAADGDPAGDVTLDGQLVYASVDDGSLPGLVFSQDGALHAWDARTGAARWSHAAYLTTSALIVRGRIYAGTSQGVVALDGRTGEPAWSTAGREAPFMNGLFTDGRHVLVTLEPGPTTGGRLLVAYDAVTGEESFRALYPAGINLVGEAGHRLVGQDSATDEYVVLG